MRDTTRESMRNTTSESMRETTHVCEKYNQGVDGENNQRDYERHNQEVLRDTTIGCILLSLVDNQRIRDTIK